MLFIPSTSFLRHLSHQKPQAKESPLRATKLASTVWWFESTLVDYPQEGCGAQAVHCSMNFQSQLDTCRKTTSSTLTKTFFSLPPYPEKNPTVRGWGVDPIHKYIYIYKYMCMYIYIYTYIYTPIIHPQEFITQFSHAPPPRCQGWIVNAINAENLRLRNLDNVWRESSFQTLLIPQQWPCSCWILGWNFSWNVISTYLPIKGYIEKHI